MALIIHPVSPPLSFYVERIYYVDGSMPYQREKILPAAWLDLKINLGGAIKVYEQDRAEPSSICADSWSVGLWNTYHVVEWPEDMRFFGVFFKPGGAYPFLQLPMSELHNHVVSLDLIWGNFAAEIRQRLHAVPSIPAALCLLEQLLLNRLREAPYRFKVVQYALAEIARHHGNLSIRTLSDHIGVSPNYLTAQFKLLIGGTPKELARLYRFQRVLDHLDLAQPIEWTWIAHQAQYYDQSHFNKDFAAFTGHSPTDYLRLRRQVQTDNPHHAPFLRELPIE
jgi:AraC-like DNA-binding protein